jgi:hypothetical protein
MIKIDEKRFQQILDDLYRARKEKVFLEIAIIQLETELKEEKNEEI